MRCHDKLGSTWQYNSLQIVAGPAVYVVVVGGVQKGRYLFRLLAIEYCSVFCYPLPQHTEYGWVVVIRNGIFIPLRSTSKERGTTMYKIKHG